MDTSQVQQIVETIKTLNLNVNSKTLENVVSQISPLLWWKLVFIPIMEDVFFTGIFLLAIILFYKVWIKE
jgi:hypothetical protein